MARLAAEAAELEAAKEARLRGNFAKVRKTAKNIGQASHVSKDLSAARRLWRKAIRLVITNQRQQQNMVGCLKSRAMKGMSIGERLKRIEDRLYKDVKASPVSIRFLQFGYFVQFFCLSIFFFNCRVSTTVVCEFGVARSQVCARARRGPPQELNARLDSMENADEGRAMLVARLQAALEEMRALLKGFADKVETREALDELNARLGALEGDKVSAAAFDSLASQQQARRGAREQRRHSGRRNARRFFGLQTEHVTPGWTIGRWTMGGGGFLLSTPATTPVDTQ